ncbi:MAG: hypothetical protein A7316_06145 [Candidatus Altiarchaeales archaeon WOR_SM1_86-2]|nr:MAG: hypothetical protein A7316_06145 [Candidatus Altiarchaeales archaeon WOR_SM1_86-2]ODS41382.1 MAG: hypothetical protein A7315_06505 [Candidatus Altiarchaeales archaeon WOR_SM1_79]
MAIFVGIIFSVACIILLITAHGSFIERLKILISCPSRDEIFLTGVILIIITSTGVIHTLNILTGGPLGDSGALVYTVVLSILLLLPYLFIFDQLYPVHPGSWEEKELRLRKDIERRRRMRELEGRRQERTTCDISRYYAGGYREQQSSTAAQRTRIQRPAQRTLEVLRQKPLPRHTKGFSAVKESRYPEIPGEAMDPFTMDNVHDLIKDGKKIVKCEECGIYFDEEVWEYFGKTCVRIGCQNNRLE